MSGKSIQSAKARRMPLQRPPPRLVTKGLSPATWPDFERLFAKHGGVQAGCWCMFYHRTGPLHESDLAGEGRRSRNRKDQRELVRQGRSHGILVYASGMAVGWCQYGLREELPRIDAKRIYRALHLPREDGPLWRITCFFVDHEFRWRGVARIALRSALQAIRDAGGGTVEGYPAIHPRAVGIWFGTVAMFEREGFQEVSALGRSNVVMRRILPAARSRRGPGLDPEPGARPRTANGLRATGARSPDRRPRRDESAWRTAGTEGIEASRHLHALNPPTICETHDHGLKWGRAEDASGKIP